MMAVPVFGAMEHYLEKVNLNESNVIRHLLVFWSAITSFYCRENCSGENFSQVLFNHLTRDREQKKESQAFRYMLRGTVELPVLRLRGGAWGDQEKFLCEICSKILTSKRNLDLQTNSVHVSHPDFDCILYQVMAFSSGSVAYATTSCPLGSGLFPI